MAIEAESEVRSEWKRPERQEKVANKLMHEATTAKVRAGGPNSIARLLAEFFPKLQGAQGRIEMALATNRSEIRGVGPRARANAGRAGWGLQAARAHQWSIPRYRPLRAGARLACTAALCKDRLGKLRQPGRITLCGQNPGV